LAPKAKRSKTSASETPKPTNSQEASYDQEEEEEDDDDEASGEAEASKVVSTTTTPLLKPKPVVTDRSLRRSTVAHSKMRKEWRALEEEEKSKRKVRYMRI